MLRVNYRIGEDKNKIRDIIVTVDSHYHVSLESIKLLTPCETNLEFNKCTQQQKSFVISKFNEGD